MTIIGKLNATSLPLPVFRRLLVFIHPSFLFGLLCLRVSGRGQWWDELQHRQQRVGRSGLLPKRTRDRDGGRYWGPPFRKRGRNHIWHGVYCIILTNDRFTLRTAVTHSTSHYCYYFFAVVLVLMQFGKRFVPVITTRISWHERQQTIHKLIIQNCWSVVGWMKYDPIPKST